VSVDRVACVKEFLEPREGRHDPRIENTVRSRRARGVDHRKNRREIEVLAGLPVRDTAAACVKAFGRAPVVVQRLGDCLRRREAGLRPRGFVGAGFRDPLSAIGEGCVVHKPGAIMVA
jgi:hypothetical protein